MKRTLYTCKKCGDPVLFYDRLGMDAFVCMECVKLGEKKCPSNQKSKCAI
jgi:hypothetical protein